MNTSKQVNLMIGLLMVGAIATLLYFLWEDLERQDTATARQLMENAERGGALFALNCSSCHGLTGKGALERSGLPGAPLNLEDNRSTRLGDVEGNQGRFRDTIRCGRVGTLMPAWSQQQGGALNDFQISQLVALITGTMPPSDGTVTLEDIPSDPNGVSEEAWVHALEETNHAQEFDPPRALAEAVGADDEALVLNTAGGLKVDDIIRVGGEALDEQYELLKVTSISEDEVEVERGAEGTEAAEHEEGAEVFNGPTPPGTTITSGTCGQLAAEPTKAPGTPAPPTEISGTVALGLGDNFFDLGGQQNPNLAVTAGESITVQLTSTGSQPHNLRTTGADGEFDNDDDAVSDPDLIAGGGSGTLAFSFTQAGTYGYRCDFHPDQMRGEITVAQ